MHRRRRHVAGPHGCRLPFDSARRHAGAGRAELSHVPGRQRLEHARRGIARQPEQRGLDVEHGRVDDEPPSRLRALGRSLQSLRHALHRGRTVTAHGARHVPIRRRERSRALPVQREHPDRRRAAVDGRSPRHHGEPGHVHPLRALRRALQRVGFDGGLGRHLEPRLERAAPGGLDVGRRGRPADPPGARPLRRGAVGRHHPRHPDDGRGDGHLVPVARPPRGRDVVQPEPPAHGRPLPAQSGLQHLRLLAPGTGRPARHAAVRADPGRQRVQLVLRRYGGRQLARRSRQRTQGGPGQRVRGGRRVAPDDRPQLRARPGSSASP